MARAGQHAHPSHKHCKPCANHAYAPWPRVNTSLHDFHLMEFSHQPVLSQLHNELKQQCDGDRTTSRTTNYELQGTGRATRAPVAQTLQIVRQSCPCTTATCTCICTIFILWNFHTNPYQPSKNYELKQQGDGAGETSRTHKLRVA